MMIKLVTLILVLGSSAMSSILCLNIDLHYDWGSSVKLQTGERIEWDLGDIGLQPMGLLKGGAYCDGSVLKSPNEFYISKMPFDSIEYCNRISLQNETYFEKSVESFDYWYSRSYDVAPGGYFGIFKTSENNFALIIFEEYIEGPDFNGDSWGPCDSKQKIHAYIQDSGLLDFSRVGLRLYDEIDSLVNVSDTLCEDEIICDVVKISRLELDNKLFRILKIGQNYEIRILNDNILDFDVSNINGKKMHISPYIDGRRFLFKNPSNTVYFLKMRSKDHKTYIKKLFLY